jgi:hypothetical protein
VADVGTHEILVFQDGEFAAVFAPGASQDLPEHPTSLEFDSEGLLYVADYSANQVLVLRPQT